jgi:hypothetical protein
MDRRAAKDGTAAAATALGGEVQSLVPMFSDSMHDGSKHSIGRFFRRIPKKAWLFMGLSVAGIVFVHNGAVFGKIYELCQLISFHSHNQPIF